MIVGDVAKLVGDIVISQDPDFIAIKSSPISIVLPDILGANAYWETESDLDWSGYENGITYDIYNNSLVITFDTPPIIGETITLHNLKVGGLENSVYPSQIDGPNEFIRLSLDNLESFTYPHTTDEINTISNIYAGQPNLSTDRIHSFILNEENADFGQILIEDDNIIQTIFDNDTMRLILPDNFGLIEFF